MNNQYSAITTLVRNKLCAPAISESIQFLANKGITVKIEDEDLYSLKSSPEADSEIAGVFRTGVIYRGPEVVCYRGPIIPELTLEEAKEHKEISWNDKSVFIECLTGKRIFMYWDTKKKNWSFADSKKSNTIYGKLITDQTYNIMAVEPFYTFVFVLDDQSNTIYLETAYDNKKGKELAWDAVFERAIRLNIPVVKYYYFEGFDKLEDSDFPLYVQDVSRRRILIRSAK
jgi:hypothetical protein